MIHEGRAAQPGDADYDWGLTEGAVGAVRQGLGVSVSISLTPPAALPGGRHEEVGR